MSKKFQRTVEDFICAHCGANVTGNGYTNHCPHCLYSKHVDINPGDREASCGGLMAPIALMQKNGAWVITHRCAACGFTRPCKTGEEDHKALLTLAKNLSNGWAK